MAALERAQVAGNPSTLIKPVLVLCGISSGFSRSVYTIL